jgi:hypothetical protein
MSTPEKAQPNAWLAQEERPPHQPAAQWERPLIFQARHVAGERVA